MYYNVGTFMLVMSRINALAFSNIPKDCKMFKD